MTSVPTSQLQLGSGYEGGLKQSAVCPQLLWKEMPHTGWENGVIRTLESSDTIQIGKGWEMLWAASESRRQ